MTTELIPIEIKANIVNGYDHDVMILVIIDPPEPVILYNLPFYDNTRTIGLGATTETWNFNVTAGIHEIVFFTDSPEFEGILVQAFMQRTEPPDFPPVTLFHNYISEFAPVIMNINVPEIEPPIIEGEPPEFPPVYPTRTFETHLPDSGSFDPGGWWRNLTQGANAIANNIAVGFQGIQRWADNIASGIEGGISNLWKILNGQLPGLMGTTVEESIKKSLEILPQVTGDSPEWKKEIDSIIKPFVTSNVNSIIADLKPENYEKSPLSPQEAANQLTILGTGVMTTKIGLFVAHAALEAATLGQYEAIKDIETMVINDLAVNNIMRNMLYIPLEHLLFKRANQHYAAQYTPEIPAYVDLINMVVKEKISLTVFKANMKYKGFDETWSQLIWDSHFIPPNLGDLILTWRRKTPVTIPEIDESTGEVRMVDRPQGLTESDLHRLFKLVDLDPDYQDIFDSRLYIDPTLRTARWGFEAGKIDPARVRQVVERAGYLPEDIDWIVEVQTTFQEREYRSRYLTALATGVSQGVYSPDELTQEVKNAGFQEGVATWMIKTAEVRARIRESTIPASKPKILSLGELKKAYTRNKIDRNFLSQELLTRNYEQSEINILLSILDEDKAFTQLGAKKLALSESQLLNAWRFDRITQDALQIELGLRGLSTDEISILIDTMKIKWEKD